MHARRYKGPIIDAHHHLWDLSMRRHPWISGRHVGVLGDVSHLQQDYLIDDLLADMAGQGVVGSVHVEALWDRIHDPSEETLWLEGLARPAGIAGRYVGYVPLAASGAAEMLERQLAASPRLAGLRETIRWHPDPARSWTLRGLTEHAAWRQGLALLRAHGLVMELLMNPYQAEEVAALAAALPDQVFIVDHCASPLDRDAAGLERWRRGLAILAARPNVAIKLSHPSAYSEGTETKALAAVVLPCLEAFGPGRAMFGSDYPMARRSMSYAAICDGLREILAPFSPSEQRAVFHDNAARYYRFPPAEPPRLSPPDGPRTVARAAGTRRRGSPRERPGERPADPPPG